MSDSSTPWIAACQTSLSITNSCSLLRLVSIKFVMPSNHLILCRPLLLLPLIFPSIRVFSNESALHVRWPKYWSFILEPVSCSMSGSNCCFLTCMQISQEAGKVVWYSHLCQNCPQFVVIHTVKGFGIINKAEVDAFLELSCFFDDSTDVGNLVSGSSAFSKSSLNIWKFSVQLKPRLENFEHYLLACEMSAIVRSLNIFGIAFLWDWNENLPFPGLRPLLSFPNLLTY